MPHPVKDNVQSVLGDYHGRIRSVIEQAWAECQLVSRLRAKNGLGPLLYPRTFANDMYDAIARYAIAEFMEDAAVHIEIESQTIKLFFRDGVVGRFKKGDDDKLGRNVETQAVLAFVDPDGCLPGFPASTAMVEFIWLANEINTRLEHVLVVARDNDRLLWDYAIEPSVVEGAGTVVLFPAPSTEPEDEDEDVPVVVPKPSVSKDDKEQK